MAKIVVIDDDDGVAFMVRDCLVSEKYQVAIGQDGEEAWNLLQANDFDLAILDWDLSDTTGVELLKKFRDAGGTAPVLMLTGRTAVSDKALGLDTGADDYLTKPFEPEELLARVRACLRRTEKKEPKPLGLHNTELLNNAGLLGTSLAARYEFIELIGEGGAGVVFKAKDPRVGRFVAIKMLHYQGMKEEVIQRFEQEARVIGKLEHPNIATVYDFGMTERRKPYMVIEFVEGQTLEHILDERKSLPFSEAIDLFIQICAGMSHAHDAGVIHRDLKPGNLMLKKQADSSITVKILDFGCAKLTGTESTKLTMDGTAIGTPAYMSPEQSTGRQPDARSDIYSLGCIIYETLTGTTPHTADDAVKMLIKHSTDDVRPLQVVRPDLFLPPGVEHLVAKALEKDPQKRYPSMKSLADDLQALKNKNNSVEEKKSDSLIGGLTNTLKGWLKRKDKEIP